MIQELVIKTWGDVQSLMDSKESFDSAVKILVDTHGCSYREIANLLGVPTMKVYRRYHNRRKIESEKLDYTDVRPFLMERRKARTQENILNEEWIKRLFIANQQTRPVKVYYEDVDCLRYYYGWVTVAEEDDDEHFRINESEDRGWRAIYIRDGWMTISPGHIVTSVDIDDLYELEGDRVF